MSLTRKENELVAVGASVASGCIPCTNYHVRKVREAEASYEEIRQAISDAMCVRNSAGKIMEAQGLKNIGIVNNIDDCGCSDDTTRINELVSVAAAFAVNCSVNLEKHISAARKIGIIDDDLVSVLDLTGFIKNKAASHVDRIAERIGSVVSLEEEMDGCGCDDNDSNTAAVDPLEKTLSAALTSGQDNCGCNGAC